MNSLLMKCLYVFLICTNVAVKPGVNLVTNEEEGSLGTNEIKRSHMAQGKRNHAARTQRWLPLARAKCSAPIWHEHSEVLSHHLVQVSAIHSTVEDQCSHVAREKRVPWICIIYI